MARTVTLTLDADLLPLMRQMADDTRVWCDRLAHDNFGRSDQQSQQIARDAYSRANNAGRIVDAIDAALSPIREAA